MNFEENLNDIEAHMCKIGGGEVLLSKQYWNEGIAVIYINHPEKKNAMSAKMKVDFRNIIKELENWKEGKAVILTGMNDNFCSGGDLSFTRQCTTKKDGFYMSALMQDVLKRYRKLPMVSVSLIHGPTMGGGAEMSVFSDFILAVDNLKFGFVHGKIGLVTAWGGTTRLVQILGERKATDLVLNPRLLSAKECFDLGLVNRIVSNEFKLQEALDFIRQYLKLDTSVLRNFKRALYSATTEKFEDSIRNEQKLFCDLYGGPVHSKALKEKINHIKNKI